MPEHADTLANDQEAQTAKVKELIALTELQHVRLTQLICRNESADWPDTFGIRVEAKDAEVRHSPESIIVNLIHEVTYGDEAERTLAFIGFTHQLTFDKTSDLDQELTSDPVIAEWVQRVAYFIGYPYARTTLQTCGLALDIPPVVLGYLRQDTAQPSSLTVLNHRSELAG